MRRLLDVEVPSDALGSLQDVHWGSGAFGYFPSYALGCLIAWSIPWLVPMIEHLLGVQFLPPSVYFISELPSELVPADVIRIGIIAFLMSAVATLYPSWRGAKVRPAEALRYE